MVQDFPHTPTLDFGCTACPRWYAGLLAPLSDAKAIWGLLVSSYMNVFLISIPLGFLAHFLSWGAVPVFVLVSTSRTVQLSAATTAECPR